TKPREPSIHGKCMPSRKASFRPLGAADPPSSVYYSHSAIIGPSKIARPVPETPPPPQSGPGFSQSGGPEVGQGLSCALPSMTRPAFDLPVSFVRFARTPRALSMSTATPTALDRARTKAYVRLLPLLFLCYVIAYVDRANVAIAKLTMTNELPAFDNAVIGFGSGVFFIGYFLLEIPGTLIVEKWSARKWISRIMISWGIVAALTAFVKVPWHFYTVRFLLGLAEAGFFPGVIVYLTHWFPSRDRARALVWFFVASP